MYAHREHAAQVIFIGRPGEGWHWPQLVRCAQHLSAFAGETVVVFHALVGECDAYATTGVINIANQMSSEEQLPNIGLIINDIKSSRSMGYNYYYGYNRGYNYGYYDYSNYYTKENENIDHVYEP